ncbi:MAG: aldolase, partial [Gammaproteobacteria bacterium]|nr:aldolase [Gammaproteobacteria bacterium]
EALSRHGALKQKIRAGQPTLGVFIRTPVASVVEALATVDLDFVVLDAEHGPFGIETLDHCILAARAAGIPPLVRLAEASHSQILSVLDLGAAGILVPHIRSAEEAGAAAAATRYTGGTRGFSASHRAAGYGNVPAAKFRELSDSSMIVIGQVEDREGVGNIDAIAAVTGLDAVFIGPADLSVSLGVQGSDDPVVEKAIETICAGCRRAGRAIGIFLRSTDEIEKYRTQGVSLFIIGTDQALLLRAARAVSAGFRAAFP